MGVNLHTCDICSEAMTEYTKGMCTGCQICLCWDCYEEAKEKYGEREDDMVGHGVTQCKECDPQEMKELRQHRQEQIKIILRRHKARVKNLMVDELMELFRRG